ncbi:TatD family deoxyribonuclease [Natronospirillum operosum]|uniref:TatD family deoxyribonuclease n=1 Tax=Natronospirillum operosum TaxID=2759953 RepID=A0A4Z0W781_9GAMM|nr:TatD family hydrolase [Natronospirillum operosum]TGG93227.1 TatD family deoxyribonuclease [Natronospirillum operosum]
MSGKSKRKEIPVFQTPLIETHCHLDYLQQDSTEAILQQARERGVERFITIAVAPDNLDTVRTLADTHDAVYCTQGVHPHEARLYTAEVGQRIRAGAESERVVAIGEIGLDYHYDNSPRAQQRQAFAEQLQIALDMALPIVVHTRDADDDTMAIFREFSGQGLRGVIHSFTSSPELAEFCLQEGFHLGFNGIITFNKAENVRAVVAETPVERILLETDSPFLTPVPFRGKENAPFYLPLVAEKVAELKDSPPEALIRQTTQNARDLFFHGA